MTKFHDFLNASGIDASAPDIQKKIDDFRSGIETFGEISKEENLALATALADDVVSTDNGLTPVQAVAVLIGAALVIARRDETGASTAITLKSFEIGLKKLIEKTAEDAGVDPTLFKQLTAARIAA